VPLNLSDNLGPKVDLQTGRWIPVSDTYIQATTGALTQRRLAVLQVSDTYLVRWFMQVTSATVSGNVTPVTNFYGAWDTGAGKALYQRGNVMAAQDIDATSSTWQLIRAANSDVYISTAVAGTAPIYNLYVSISRPS